MNVFKVSNNYSKKWMDVWLNQDQTQSSNKLGGKGGFILIESTAGPQESDNLIIRVRKKQKYPTINLFSKKSTFDYSIHETQVNIEGIEYVIWEVTVPTSSTKPETTVNVSVGEEEPGDDSLE